MEEIAIVRDKKGRFVEKPKQANVFASQSAREAAKKRWDATRLASVRAVVAEASAVDPTITTAQQAFGLLVGKQYVTMLDHDKPVIDQVDKMRRLLTGYDGNDEQTAQAPQMVMAVAELVRAIREAITPDIVIDNNNYRNHKEDDDT